MTNFLLNVLSLLTLLGNIALVLFVPWYFLGRKNRYFLNLEKLLKKRALLFAFVITLSSVLGSLYFSEIAKFEPCKLCWFQRVFMYPMPLILGMALFKKARDVIYYAMPLSVIGGLFALYHYILQMSTNPLAPCSTIGFSVSCSERFITHYGYITIPFMSLTGFVIISLLLLFTSERIKK
jgi:disulfide bond formation protein DsbB